MRTTFTPCFSNPATSPSTATLLAAEAIICPPSPLGRTRVAKRKKSRRVEVLPVPGGPCQRVRVWVRAALIAAAWLELTPPDEQSNCTQSFPSLCMSQM